MAARKIDYLRISVTDRCNLRCMYCMPKEGIEPVLHQELLTFEEILRLVKIFAGLGITKVRLTGGEPLVRKGIINLAQSLSSIKGIEETSLTTNGILLLEYAVQLKEAGVKRINISLDTLKEEKFKNITANGSLKDVLEGIKKARTLWSAPLKINTVVMKGINDDEIIDFINFALEEKLILRFIEFMKVTPLWKQDYFMPIEEVKRRCAMEFGLEKIEFPGNGPAEYYKVEESAIGFIKTDTCNCQRCNRLRLTSTGELKLCLYETMPISLKQFLRNGFSDSEICAMIAEHLKLKDEVDYRRWESFRVYMSEVGG